MLSTKPVALSSIKKIGGMLNFTMENCIATATLENTLTVKPRSAAILWLKRAEAEVQEVTKLRT